MLKIVCLSAVIVLSCSGRVQAEVEVGTPADGQLSNPATGEVGAEEPIGEDISPTNGVSEQIGVEEVPTTVSTDIAGRVGVTEESEGSGLIPKDDSEEPAPSRKKTCRSTENICVSCDVMGICVNEGRDFRTHEQPCREDEKCVNGECVLGALCNTGDFTCKQSGYFPDIEDCQVYHKCLPENGTLVKNTMRCNDSSYIAERETCGGSLDTEACITRPVPECEERGQLGPLPDSPRYYYICSETNSSLTPDLYQCPENHVFHSDTRSCLNRRPATRKPDQWHAFCREYYFLC